jgi:hypothetical protein
MWRLLAVACALACPAIVRGQPARVPLIYSTDLFHPHDDPDDHLDLATVFALPEFDVRAVLLDQGERQSEGSGRVPLDQMSKLTGWRIISAVGLSGKLESPTDTGRSQPAAFQGAVELLLKTLRESREPVTIIQVGSARDIVAAFNRDPALFRARVKAIYANIGNAAPGGKEWNVTLDPQAYVGLLRSGLPLYLAPCFPKDSPHASFWMLTSYGAALEGAPPSLQSFFLYALQKIDPAHMDPIAALSMDSRSWRGSIWSKAKEMWCTASLLHAAGREKDAPGAFRFVPVRIEVGDDGRIRRLDFSAPDSQTRILERSSVSAYETAMNASLRKLFEQFPVR